MQDVRWDTIDSEREVTRDGRGSLEAERRRCDFDFEFHLAEPGSPSSSSPEELGEISSSSFMSGKLGGLDIRKPGMHEFAVWAGGFVAGGKAGDGGGVDSKLILNVCRRCARCFVSWSVCEARLGVERIMKKARPWRTNHDRTAVSVSAMTFRDFSLSRLSCAKSEISDWRSRRFSTWRTVISALSSSIRMLSVEFNLARQSMSNIEPSLKYGTDYLVMCLLARRNFFLTVDKRHSAVSVWLRDQYNMVDVRLSYSASASACLAPLEARGSLLLIVDGSETMARSTLLTAATCTRAIKGQQFPT